MNIDCEIIDLINECEKFCDIPKNQLIEYRNNIDNDLKYITFLIRNSNKHEIRNIVKPYGELYTTLEFTSDYMIKLIDKINWGGHLITITFWDLLVIDFDINVYYEDIVDLLTYHYPEDTFYIHETNKGYHAFLMNRLINSSTKESTIMKIKLHSDEAHVANGIYTGNSLRLCLKKNDRLDIASKYIGYVGCIDNINDKCKQLYDKLNEYLIFFREFNTENITSKLKLIYNTEFSGVLMRAFFILISFITLPVFACPQLA